jgi:hypothetical protein
MGAYLEDDATAVVVYHSKSVGFRLLGVTHSIISNEACMTVGSGHTADLVRLDEYASATTTQSTNNLLQNLRSYDFDATVREVSTADSNRIEGCYNYGSSGLRDPVVVGPSTSVIRWVPIASNPGCWSFEGGVLFGDGTAARPAIAADQTSAPQGT